MPPSHKVGWPWTVESAWPREGGPGGRSWPRITIVTPSYNQAQFLEETLRSVLLQGYPNLEYIVIDGGSTDNSVDIIRKYEPWLAHWVSEKDRGQSDAINKGWNRGTGTILAWLNSDDRYEPGALTSAALSFMEHPEAVVVYGDWAIIDADGSRRSVVPGDYTRQKLLEFWRGYYGIGQPASFFSRRLLQQQGILDDRLRYIMDYEYYLRAGRIGEFARADGVLASFRVHGQSKTSSNLSYFAEEHVKVARSLRGSSEIKDFAEYMRNVRSYYASALVSGLLSGASFHGHHPFRVLAQAIRNDSRLLRELWVWKLALKQILGPAWTRRVNRWRAAFEGSENHAAC